jgi:23S rRNA (cytidine1920-2'-O)/16S rRNA (cytidine1409-2'-O)-methyltransferase
MARIRLDQALVERGFFESRAQAQAAIFASRVTIDGKPASKPAQAIAPKALLVAEAPHPFVSRGGVKLAAALQAFNVAPAGRNAVDVGASTGGFTDCLLQHGARHVTAIDVGTGQLHQRLTADARVTSFEKTDIRGVAKADLPVEPDLAVVDVSFISVIAILPALLTLLNRPADIMLLVKPQFELGPSALKKGIVRAEVDRQQALIYVMHALDRHGVPAAGSITSPITGGDGNIEFLVHVPVRN